MRALLELVKQENVFLSYKNLHYPSRVLLGLYYFDPIKCTSNIIIESTLEHNLPLHRSVLAEELGHYYTAPQTSILTPYTSYTLKIQLSRDEAKAIRWACDFLMPDEQFSQAIEKGLWDRDELAEYFVVTPWLVSQKLHFLSVGSSYNLRYRLKQVAVTKERPTKNINMYAKKHTIESE